MLQKQKYECDQCEKLYVVKEALQKHKEAKHGDNNKIEKSETQKTVVIKENKEDFPEDEDFDQAVKDQEIYDFLENLTQKLETGDGDISSSDINTLNTKLLRYIRIAKKKTKIQDKTNAELAQVKEEKERLLEELEAYKKSSLVMKFFRCTECENTFSSSDNLELHMKDHEMRD